MLIFFIVALVLSGVTAFPIQWELGWAIQLLETWNVEGVLFEWMDRVNAGVNAAYEEAPFIGYGTDWLAFGHLVIAVAFIGPLINPIKNKFIIQFGMIASVMIIPMALIAGPIREIPFWWQIVDCSFGVFGFLCLHYCYRLILKLEQTTNLNTSS